MENQYSDEVHNYLIKPRVNPMRRRDKVYIGCGAGFNSDRPLAALKLLQNVKELNYLILECLAERTLADRYKEMISGGDGYDPCISEWMQLLLPLAVERGTCIITNMGAMDAIGAQQKVLGIAASLGLNAVVAVAHEVASNDSGSRYMDGTTSTYLGAAPIVRCLESYKPSVIITSRVADAALFLAPLIYELGWNWSDLEQLAQGALAGHLLECGCQLTGGYFMHPGDKYRDMPFPRLLDLSLPFAEISYHGEVCVAKANASGGLLNFSTCAQQLLYEVADPSAYITPDVVLDIRDVTFRPLSSDKVLCIGAKPSATSRPEKLLQLVQKECGWKGWGEISYGGSKCVKRAMAAEFLVRSWMEELNPGVNSCINAYIIGLDSLKAAGDEGVHSTEAECRDIRLRMDGLFAREEHAIQFVREFTALYTNGPAGGGGISTGHKKEVLLEKQLVSRDSIFWHVGARSTNSTYLQKQKRDKTAVVNKQTSNLPKSIPLSFGEIRCAKSPYGLSPHGRQMSNYSSLDGVLYCKAHFEQLFKESGDFRKNFQTVSKTDKQIEQNRTPNKVSSMFSGTQDKCPACNKTVYPLEKITMEGESYHKSCFKCAVGGCPLTHSSYAALDGILYCKHHFQQLFMEKGNYSHVKNAAKKNQASATDAEGGEPLAEEGSPKAAENAEPEPTEAPSAEE